MESNSTLDLDTSASRVIYLKCRSQEIQDEITSFKLTQNQKRKPQFIPVEIRERRAQLIAELKEVQAELTDIGKSKAHRSYSEHITVLFDVLRESLGEKELKRLSGEVRRRLIGMEPVTFKLEYGYDPKQSEEIKRLRTLAIGMRDDLLKARKTINKYISDNEPAVNKADYLRKVSDLNKSVVSESELQKIKI